MASSSPDAIPTRLDVVRTLVRARLRSQLRYRSSFATDLFGQIMLVPLEFVEIWALLHAAPLFAGMDLTAATVLYGLAILSFGVADMLCGQIDGVNKLIKNGTLDVLLTRPTSLIVQLVTQDLQLRRLGRAATGLVLYVMALLIAHVQPTPANLAIMVLAPIGGVLIFTALFLFAASCLFFILDGNQAVNAFTYGSRYAAGVPGAALMTPVKIFFTFVTPATLIAYVPTAVLTGSPLPPFWWSGWAWLTVPLGVVMWAVMLLWWRIAIRHYTGAGG